MQEIPDNLGVLCPECGALHAPVVRCGIVDSTATRRSEQQAVRVMVTETEVGLVKDKI